MKKKLIITSLILSALYIITCIVIYFMFNQRLLKTTVKTNHYYNDFIKNKDMTTNKIKVDQKDFTYHYIDHKSNKTIILTHGVTSSKENVSLIASKLYDQKYNVVLYDLRTHGENKSIGTVPTFGYWEKEDLRKIIKDVKNKHANNQISLYGVSMGGATTLSYAQKYDYLNDIKSYVVESVYEDMYKQSNKESKDTFPLGIYPFRWAINLMFKIHHNYSTYDISFVKNMYKIKHPMNLITPSNDPRISKENSINLYNNGQNKNVFYTAFDDKTHANAWKGKNNKQYFKVLEDFYKKYF